MKRSFLSLLLLTFVAGCAGRKPRPTLPPPPPAPKAVPGAIQEGIASWYGLEERGRPTASGEPMDPERFTAAHPSWPFGTLVRVTDKETGRSVLVVINDRGPFVSGRIIDLSHGAAEALGVARKGIAPVRVEVLEIDRSRLVTRWRVQVGSFRDASRARDVARAVEADGHRPVAISAFRRGSQTFYRVWVGEFTDRPAAERLAIRLRREGREVVVVRTPMDTE